jgi:hypothetical protein
MNNGCLGFLPNPNGHETGNLPSTLARPGLRYGESVTPSRRLLAASWLGVAVLCLGACGGDDDPTGTGSSTPPASTSTASESGDPTTAPSDTGSPSPTVAPATGIELREQSSSIHVPVRWRAAPPLASYQSAATGPQGAGTIDLIDDETLNPGAPLEVRVDSAIKTLPKGATYTRLPDIMLGDSLAYHLTYTTPGRTEVNDVIETERNQRLITIDFYLSAKALAKHPDTVASVLATFQWID